MNLSMSDLLCGNISNYSKSGDPRDTALQHDCFNRNTSSSIRVGDPYKELPVQDDRCILVLGLGPSPSSYSKNNCSVTTLEAKNIGAQFSQELSNDAGSRMLQLGLSRVGEPVTSTVQNSTNVHNPQSQFFINSKSSSLLVAGDGSATTVMKSGGYMASLVLAPRIEGGTSIKSISENNIFQHQNLLRPEPSVTTDCSVGGPSDPAVIDVIHEPKAYHHHPRKCRFRGCCKGARGASGLCIVHGGGERCHKPGCTKGAESRTAFCKSHGGGRRCQHLGCTKSAEGKTDFCIAHGGGHRCSHPGCTKAARGKSGLCIRHGGGKRCSIEGCTRSAEGQVGLCISHGGGRRCQYPGCSKGAQGSTMHCKSHGGGKRCIVVGCTKGAEGSTPLCKGHGGGKRCLHNDGGVCTKSVHGGTDYCVAHGGGKRCAVAGCTKSARGRTDCCVRHGGGRRCRFEGCGKSAQGSTDFCKAHGGGKRCNWTRGCDKYARGKSGLCAVHGSMVVDKHESMITSGLFHGIVSGATAAESSVDNDYSSSTVNASSDGMAKRLQARPPQVLFPLSTMSQSSDMADREVERGSNDKILVPEGRVHGGGLMFLLGGNFRQADVGDSCE